MTLLKQILRIKKVSANNFTTPSHSQVIPFSSALGDKYYGVDFSEIEGLDNLQCPSGCIKEMIEKLTEIYHSGISYPLTNGSTQGLTALIMSLVTTGDKVLVSRNCHKSVHSAIILSQATPIWIMPYFDDEFGIYKSVSSIQIEEQLNNDTKIKCVVITNPTYDGMLSDVSKIAEICKSHNVALIVDEAHGALWNFDKTIGTPAIFAGADASVQSLHKTAGAVNPAAILHVAKTSMINPERLKNCLNLITTTSPSYPLLVNIEETVDFLNSKKGLKTLDTLVANLINFYNKIKKFEHIRIYNYNNDLTKILLNFSKMRTEEVINILYSKFHIEPEIQHECSLNFLCGIGTTQKKLDNLFKALNYVNKISAKRENILVSPKILPTPILKLPPYIAFATETKNIEKELAIGKTSAELIINYPPGIPVLSFGEEIQKEHLPFLMDKTTIKIVS